MLWEKWNEWGSTKWNSIIYNSSVLLLVIYIMSLGYIFISVICVLVCCLYINFCYLYINCYLYIHFCYLYVNCYLYINFCYLYINFSEMWTGLPGNHVKKNEPTYSTSIKVFYKVVWKWVQIYADNVNISDLKIIKSIELVPPE